MKHKEREQQGLSLGAADKEQLLALLKIPSMCPCFLCGSHDVSERDVFVPNEAFMRRIRVPLGRQQIVIVDLCCDCATDENRSQRIEDKILRELQVS